MSTFLSFFYVFLNTRQEFSGTQIAPWILGAAVLVFMIWVIACYKNEVSCQSTGAKFLLGFLRLLIFIILLAILAEPTWREETYTVKKSNMLFLIDTSLSMKIEDRYLDKEYKEKLFKAIAQPGDNFELDKTSRIEIAQRLLKNSKRLKELAKECNVHYFKFDTVLAKLNKLENLEAKGQKTNIFDHLIKAIDVMQGRDIAAIVLLSDGQHNTGRKGWQQAANYAYKTKIPVYTIGVGSSQEKRDIILTAVEAPEVALINDQVPFEIELKNIGYEGEEVSIYLKWGERLLAEKNVTLGKRGVRQKVIVTHTFVEAENYTITALVEPQDDEFSKDNNSRQHNIKIIEQKLRVLYLEGPPRWEYRYLKNSLIRDDTVLANTWLYSADRDFPQDKSREAPTIKGFPSKEELLKYHCVIIGDVDVKDDLTEDKQKLLVEYVKDYGGGIVFIAGSNNNPREYWNTELFPLLPVDIDITQELTGPFTEEQGIRLSREGRRHSIMRLLPNTEDNVRLWENEREGLRQFYWYFPVAKSKPGATVLAVVRDSQTPLFVSQFYGKGKTFFSAVDSSWRWRYIYGDRYFYRFWGQVIRHTSMGMLVGRGRQYYLRVDNPQYIIGEMVNIILRVIDSQNRKPVEQKEWEVNYTVHGETKKKILQARPNEKGTYEGTLIATAIGNYKVWLKTEEGKEVSTVFNVVAPLAESGKPQLNESALQDLANKTYKGSYLQPFELEDMLKKFNPPKETFPIKVRNQTLFDKDWIHWVFFLIIALFTIEWIIRKLMRLL